MSENMDLMDEIARKLIQSEEISSAVGNFDWTEITMIFCVDGDEKVNSTYGYAYDAKGAWKAISIRPRDIRPQVTAYREYLRVPGDKGFIKMLFQFNRVSLRVNAGFEFEDASRWKVTPNNIDTLIEELRPHLK